MFVPTLILARISGGGGCPPPPSPPNQTSNWSTSMSSGSGWLAGCCGRSRRDGHEAVLLQSLDVEDLHGLRAFLPILLWPPRGR